MSDVKTYLADLIEPPRAGFWGANEKSTIASIPCRVVRNGDVAKDGYIERDGLPIRWFSAGELDKAEINRDDIVLVSSGAYTGNAGKVIGLPDGHRVIASNFVRRLRPKREFVADWVFHLVRSDVVQVCVPAHTGGSAIPNLSSSLYGKCAVTSPPTPERQRFVADTLNAVDEAIEQTDALIAKQQQVKAGLMQDLFTRGLTPDGQLRPTRADAPHLYHETPLGWLPKEWMPTPFAKCASSFFLGTTLRGVGAGTESVPLLKMGNLTWGELDISEVEPLAMGKVTDERHWLQSGDFLFNTRNTPELVGKTAVYRGEFERCTYDNNLLRVRFKGGLDSRFVCYYMSHGRGQQRVFALATGTTSVAAIYWSALARFDLPVPVRPKESADIADRVDTARAAIAAEAAHLAKLRQLKQGLMQALLTPPGSCTA